VARSSISLFSLLDLLLDRLGLLELRLLCRLLLLVLYPRLEGNPSYVRQRLHARVEAGFGRWLACWSLPVY